MKKIIGIIFLVALLAGCASAPRPTAQQIDAADCGPFPANYEEIIKSIASKNLIDPYSAQYTFSKPEKRWNNMTGTLVFGWAVCGTVNAKNRFGGYVGAKPYYALINNDKIIRFLFGGTTIPDSFGMGILSGAMTQSGTSEDMCLKNELEIKKTLKNRGKIGILLKKDEIIKLLDNGPAERAGIMKGDIILKIDGEAITGDMSKDSIRISGTPGSTVILLLKRNGQELTIPVIRGNP